MQSRKWSGPELEVVDAVQPPAAEHLLRGVAGADFVHKADAVGLDGLEQLPLVGQVDAGHRLRPHDAVHRDLQQLLHAADGGSAGHPQPVHTQVGHRLVVDEVGPVAVPVVPLEHPEHIVRRNHPQVVGVDVPVAVLVVAAAAPGGEGDAHVGLAAAVGLVVAPSAFPFADDFE